MHDLIHDAKTLRAAIVEAMTKLNIAGQEEELQKLQQQTADPSLWTDQERAGRLMKQQSVLDDKVTSWQKLLKSTDEIVELAETNDESLGTDLRNQLDKTKDVYNQKKTDLMFNGDYDDHDAIISIHAGAGGTDAQDWAQMLHRMYVRWAESHTFSVESIDESSGDEAGIKSATMKISGTYVYGKLRGEHGVHRLVRLSPFNSDNLRQTSFAKIEIVPVIDEPEEVEIDEKDLKIDVYRSGGKGGQSVNTTDSAVRITHTPTNIVIAIQNERSQLQNKETAMTILRSKLAQLKLEQHKENISDLKGPNEQAAWGNQIRSYVLHPYKQVKDLRSRYETSDTEAVLDGKLDDFITAYLEYNISD